jgi:hypothetical protein
MYQFTNENQREFGLGNEVIISDGSPFEIKNQKLANSLLTRGIIKMVAELGKEIAKDATAKAIDKVVDKATEKITKK